MNFVGDFDGKNRALANSVGRRAREGWVEGVNPTE